MHKPRYWAKRHVYPNATWEIPEKVSNLLKQFFLAQILNRMDSHDGVEWRSAAGISDRQNGLIGEFPKQGRHPLNKRFMCSWLSFFVIIAFTTLSHSEIYKYTDAHGNILFTDDIGRIPVDQRVDVERYPEVKTSPDRSKRKASNPMPAYCQLSYRDMQLAEILIAKGFIDPDNDCPSEAELRYFEKILRQAYGIEDIVSWKPDPRFSTPVSTWQQHIDAMISGDIDLAAACFSPRVAEQKKSMYSAIGKEKLRQIALEMHPIQKISAADNYAKYRIRRTEIHGGRSHDITYYINFSNILGEWRILNY